MSELAAALQGRQFSGPEAHIEEAPPSGMISLRGDLLAAEMAVAVETVSGCAIPRRRQIVQADQRSVAWMSPDELLLLVPRPEATEAVSELAAILSGTHHLAADVSDARAAFRISGRGGREILARLCPADLSPAAFGPGELRRTRLAQVPAAFWVDERGVFSLICFRSVAAYAFDVLAQAAAGAEVGFLPPAEGS